MNRLLNIMVVLVSTIGWTQSTTSQLRPVTTSICAKNSTDTRELLDCFNEFLQKEVRKTLVIDEIIQDIPYNVKLSVSFTVDTSAVIQLNEIKMHWHPVDAVVIKSIEQQVYKLFDRINEKTKLGEGLVAARDYNGKLKSYKSYFPLILSSVYSSTTEIKNLTTEFEKKFKEKAIYAKRQDDLCFLFYENTLNKEISVYQLDTTNKALTLLNQYSNIAATFQDYPSIEEDLNTTNYSVCYFFYKDYNYLYKIQREGEEYKVIHFKYKTESTNVIFESLLSLYYSYFQSFLLHK